MKKYDIPNCKYYVTDEGRLFNKITNEEFNPCVNNGYRIISVNGKNVRLARLVATAFIPNPNNLPEVDHINRIKTDDRVDNLRWVTRKENNNNRDYTVSQDTSTRQGATDRQREKYHTNPEFRRKYIEAVKRCQAKKRHSMKTP